MARSLLVRIISIALLLGSSILAAAPEDEAISLYSRGMYGDAIKKYCNGYLNGEIFSMYMLGQMLYRGEGAVKNLRLSRMVFSEIMKSYPTWPIPDDYVNSKNDNLLIAKSAKMLDTIELEIGDDDNNEEDYEIAHVCGTLPSRGIVQKVRKVYALALSYQDSVTIDIEYPADGDSVVKRVAISETLFDKDRGFLFRIENNTKEEIQRYTVTNVYGEVISVCLPWEDSTEKTLDAALSKLVGVSYGSAMYIPNLLGLAFPNTRWLDNLKHKKMPEGSPVFELTGELPSGKVVTIWVDKRTYLVTQIQITDATDTRDQRWKSIIMHYQSQINHKRISKQLIDESKHCNSRTFESE